MLILCFERTFLRLEPELLIFDYDDNQYNVIYPNIHNNVNYVQMQHLYTFHNQHTDVSAVQVNFDDLIKLKAKTN